MREEKLRCHPSIIVEKFKGIITTIFLIVITSLDDIKEMVFYGDFSGYLIVFGILLVLLVIVLVYNILVWSKTFISIEENTIVIQRNTLSSKVNTYGIKNISNINLEQNIFERIVGTYKIKIDTDSLSTANTTDIEIILSKEKAYEFKNTVLKLMNREKLSSIDESQDTEKVDFLQEENIEYDLIYSTKDILKHCVFNLSILGIIISLGVMAFTIFISMQMDEFKGMITISLFIITSIVGLIKNILGDLFKYYKFSIKRFEDELYISCGMFKKRKYTIPINRINAVNIKQPLISRIFNRYSVDIVTIGVGDDESEGAQILLSNKKEELIKNMSILLPELNFNECIDLRRESKKRIIISFIKIIINLILIAIISYPILEINNEISIISLLTIVIVIILINLIISYMSYITRGCHLGEENIITSWGIFTKQITIIKYKKIQYINIKENPISLKLNLCKGELHILAGIGNELKYVGYYDRNLFEKIRENIIK